MQSSQVTLQSTNQSTQSQVDQANNQTDSQSTQSYQPSQQLVQQPSQAQYLTTLLRSNEPQSAKTVYNDTSATSVPSGDWFKVNVYSGDLANVKKGDTYNVTVGQGMGLNYDSSAITTPNFDIVNHGNGSYDLTANNNYDHANFDITASMSYPKSVTQITKINLPVTISHNGQTNNLSTDVFIAPAPKPTYEESHPLVKYVCFGKIPDTDRIAWGIYVNYTKQQLKDLNIDGSFTGNQTLIKKSIMAYNVADDEITNANGYILDASNHNYEHYNYDMSAYIQSGSDEHNINIKSNGPLVVNNKDYSKQPMYIYFQTEVPKSTDPATIKSDLNVKADGVSVKKTSTPNAPSGNGGSSDGANDQTEKVSDTKTVNETVHYIYSDKTTAHDDYVAKPVNFTRTGIKNLTTGKVTWGDWSADRTFGEVTSPKIKGYTADQEKIGAKTVSAKDKDLDFTVVYTKNLDKKVSDSKTINETIHYVYSDGKTAHDDYVAVPVKFTRTGSQDPVTDKITWGDWSADRTFGEVTSPKIKGYTADQEKIGAKTVSAKDKDLDFTVVYTKNPDKKVSDSKTINETIHYVYKDTGNTAAPDYKATSITFTRTGLEDAATGEISWGAWSENQSFAAKESPTIKGYTPDQAEIASQSVGPTSDDLDFTVYYDKQEPTSPSNPTQPTQPSQATDPTQPTQPTQPSQVTNPTQPTQPSHVTTPTQPTQPSQATDPTQPTQLSQATDPTQPTQPSQVTEPTLDTQLTNQPSAPETSNEPGQPVAPTNLAISGTPTEPVTMSKSEHSIKLPQTGNENSKLATIVGVGLLGILAAGLGLGKKRRHN